MDTPRIEHVLGLQRRAYGLLLWLNQKAAAHPETLSDQNIAKWRFADTCLVWVRDTRGMFPPALRPGDGDLTAFANLFSSFFQTSIRVTERSPSRDWNPWEEADPGSGGHRKLAAGTVTKKSSAKSKARKEQTMRELRLIALGNLAREHGLASDAAALARIERAGTHRPALDLWTYFHELDRRTNFASQGTAVHGIWQSLPKEQRENLSASDIVRARDVLLKAMQAEPLFPERIS